MPGGGRSSRIRSASSHRPSRARQPSQASRGETPGRRAPPARPSAASASAASRRRVAGSAAPYVSATSRSLPEERECHQGVVVILREEFTGPRPRPVRRVGSTHGRVGDAQPVVGERGASGHSSPRPRFVDERDELFVRVNRRTQVSGSGWMPAVGALPKVEPGGMEPRDRAFVLSSVDRGRRREEDVEPRLDRGRHLCSLERSRLERSESSLTFPRIRLGTDPNSRASLRERRRARRR